MVARKALIWAAVREMVMCDVTIVTIGYVFVFNVWKLYCGATL
jgi:hypothetical protein